MKHALDLTKVWEKYKGQWVAFDTKYNVISANKDAKEAYLKAKQKGFDRPILLNMPHENMPYFGSSIFTA